MSQWFSAVHYIRYICVQPGCGSVMLWLIMNSFVLPLHRLLIRSIPRTVQFYKFVCAWKLVLCCQNVLNITREFYIWMTIGYPELLFRYKLWRSFENNKHSSANLNKYGFLRGKSTPKIRYWLTQILYICIF